MAIILQDKSLEKELIELSLKFHIKTEDLLRRFVKNQLEKFKNNIDTSHIELVDENEKREILKNLYKIKDNSIDTKATKIIQI